MPPTTGTIVVCPPFSVVNHRFPIRVVLVGTSVENPGGSVLIVEVIKSKSRREVELDVKLGLGIFGRIPGVVVVVGGHTGNISVVVSG